MALFTKIDDLEIPEEGKKIPVAVDFEIIEGTIVRQKTLRVKGAEMKFFLVESGINGSQKRETVFCPLEFLGIFESTSFREQSVVIKPNSMVWDTTRDHCRIDKRTPRRRRIREEDKPRQIKRRPYRPARPCFN